MCMQELITCVSTLFVCVCVCVCACVCVHTHGCPVRGHSSGSWGEIPGNISRFSLISCSWELKADISTAYFLWYSKRTERELREGKRWGRERGRRRRREEEGGRKEEMWVGEGRKGGGGGGGGGGGERERWREENEREKGSHGNGQLLQEYIRGDCTYCHQTPLHVEVVSVNYHSW